MKTFFTSSTLAILSAVVFAWYLVQTGEELPRRSPDSYPPIGEKPPESIPPVPQQAVDVVVSEATEEEPDIPAEVEAEGQRREASPETETSGEEADLSEEERKSHIVEKQEPEYFEPMGPPAPYLPFVLNINAAEETVALQGSIPTVAMKEVIQTSMGEVFGEREMEDRLKFSPDTRSGLWIGYLPDFLDKYFRYTGGNHEVTIVDETLILSGAVATEEAKKALLKWANPLKRRGLEVRDQVDVDEAIQGKVKKIPEELNGFRPARFSPFRRNFVTRKHSGKKPAEIEETDSLEGDTGEGELAARSETGENREGELAYLAPFEEQYSVHTVPNLRGDDTDSSHEDSSGTSPGEGTEENSEDSAPAYDDGKPLIFEFESPEGEIVASDRPKIEFAIERAQRRRSIVYITGYSDYRGDFEANQKLALARANKVKDLIFSEEVAESVSAEVKTKGDLLSQKRPGQENEEQLRRSRRVVVEVYHLK